MADPSISFVGSALIDNGGSVLPYSFSSPHIIVWAFRGNTPENNFKAGWIRAIIDTDIGENYAGNAIRLYFGRVKLFFPIYPFDPPFKLQIILPPYISVLDCQFYQVAPAQTEPIGNLSPDPSSDPQDPYIINASTGNSYGGLITP